MLHVHLLGSFHLVHGGTHLTTFSSRRLQALLAWLVLHAGVPQARSRLAALVWPDSSEAQARTNLRKLLHELRQAVPSAESLLALEGPTLYWRAEAPYTCDVAAFEAALHNAQTPSALAHAISLYRGDLLPECYDDWVLLERERLRQTFTGLLERGIVQAEQGQDYATASQYARRLLEHDPLHEPGYRHLMRLLAVQGDRAGALCVYQTCCATLQRELGVAPSRATRTFYERLRAPDAGPALPGEGPGPLPHPPHNLPVPPNALIDRAREVDVAFGLLRRPDVRLLTLTGPGGVGKTRVALQVAASLLEHFPHGVFFVPLASLRDPPPVASAIARALHVQENEDRPLVESLVRSLRDSQLLLVLDNFEHLLAAGKLVARLLAAARGLKVLVTSRAVLRLASEHEFPLSPMPLPDLACLPPLAAVAQNEAVALFTQRAQSVKPDFQLTEANVAAVAEICVRLDGLPLAIELAATRVKLLPPQALATRLEHRLALLTAGPQDAPARQQTLRGTIDWSYNLLSLDAQTLLARLAVFRGHSTLAAVDELCNPDGALDVVASLTALLDNSLLRQEEHAGQARFSMLETLSEYALERLEESGEAEELRQRHAAHYLRLVEEAGREQTGPQEAPWLARLEAERDNLQAALQWALDGGHLELGLNMAGALVRFWQVHGHLSEGRWWLEALLARGSMVSPLVRAKALRGAGVLAWEQGDYARAQALQEGSLALARELGDRWGMAFTLMALGVVASDQGEHERAVPLYEESLAMFREMDDPWGIGVVLEYLGKVMLYRGDDERAKTLFEEALVLATTLGDQKGIRDVHNDLGFVALDARDYRAAMAHFWQGLTLAQELGDRQFIAESLEGLAGVAGAQGQAERAARLWGAAEALRVAVGAPSSPAERAHYESYRHTARAHLDEASYAVAWAEGRAMTVEQAVAYAGETRAPDADRDYDAAS